MSVIDLPLDPIAEEVAALDRIARSHDGQLLHRHLRRILEAVFDFENVGALQAQQGRRSLARDLMRHMAEGISSSGRSDSDPILTRGARAVSTRGRGIGRRVGPSEPYADPDASPSNPGPSSGAD